MKGWEKGRANKGLSGEQGYVLKSALRAVTGHNAEEEGAR